VTTSFSKTLLNGVSYIRRNVQTSGAAKRILGLFNEGVSTE